MQQLILGTAGHIDHGKSALVRALTGVDPDRLPEERSRGMTIVLGFAPLELNGVQYGVVDVPGHERFVRTMVAGAGGVDVAMLVVAADDGVMPQTVEHAEILDLLGIRQAVVAINKCDLVPTDRVEAVKAQVHELIADTGFAEAAVVPVSARAETGIAELRQALEAAGGRVVAPAASSVFRLAIDRVFSVKGRGTVVTGSVLRGSVHTGDALELLPGGAAMRVRELQSHSDTRSALADGQRAAVNLAGASKDDVRVGCELATPGYLSPTRYIDARIRVLSRAVTALKPHAWVRLTIGTTEIMARLVTRGRAVLEPGATAIVQLRLREPHVADYGQRFILRDETASRTVGGGRVLRPAARRWSATSAITDAEWADLDSDDPLRRMDVVRRLAGFAPVSDMALASQAGVEPGDVAALCEQLERDGVLARIDGLPHAVHRAVLDDLARRSAARVLRLHAKEPQAVGMPADALTTWLARRSAKGLGRTLLDRFVAGGTLLRQGDYACHPNHQPAMSAQDQKLYDAIMAELRLGEFAPPALADLNCVEPSQRERARRLVEHATARGALVRIDASILLPADRLHELQDTVRALIQRQGPVTLSQVRQAVGTSRKYAVPYMEYLDKTRFTKRMGDKRILAETHA